MKRNWEYKKLGDVCDVIMGQSPASDTYNESEGLPFFQGNADFGKEHPEVRVYCNSPIKIALPNDILISVRAPIGAINIADCKCCIGRGLAAIRTGSGVSNRFIYRLLIASRNKLIAQGTGSTFKSIGRSVLAGLSFPVPPLEEQSRIVAELDLLTGIIDKQNAQLKELDNLAQAIFYDMFGDLDDNRKGFDVRTLNEVFSLITDGTHQTPVYTDDKERGYKFLSAKDVTTGKIEWSSVKYIPSSLHKELSRRLAPQRGDILLCKNGTTGICALVETDEVFDIYVSLALLRTENSYNKTFLVYAINNPSTKRQFDDSLKGVGVPNLHLGEIKKTKIIIPPLALQQSFAEKIQSIEKQKETIRASIADTQKLLDYTMDKYFG